MSMMDKIKYFLGVDDEEDYEEYEEEEIVENAAPQEVREEKSFFKSRPKSDNVLSMNSKRVSSGMVITVQEPLSYDEAPMIIDDLKMGKAVVVNFEQLEASVKRQIFDFINGGIYSIEGRIQKVTRDIFVLAPKNVGIDGVKEEIK